MAEADELDDDLFADLYGNDDGQPKPSEPSPPQSVAPKQEPVPNADIPAQSIEQHGANGININGNMKQEADEEPQVYGENIYEDDNVQNGPIGYGRDENMHNMQNMTNGSYTNDHGFAGTVGTKEDGKMFIGGLNWETTDQSLKDYFSQFGEVLECTVMRDGATGRSRGFGFLTFKDPKTVNTVMVKEHYLDGKIIDPKRAIPRDEQERTSKIFVGGVSQEATERDFENFFSQFGRVVDATLMMDKDTGRPRGFGFVTFEGEAAVDACLAQPLEIMGKPIEVKRAQPRGGRDEEEGRGGRFGRRGNDRFGRDAGQGMDGGQGQMPQGQMNGMSPQMMAAYWQRMQQYFQMMQQQMAQNTNAGQGNMQGMNPQMMQQMMAMGGGPGGHMNRAGTGSPLPQSPGPGNMQGMNPQMMQQMQMMQQQQQGGRSMSPASMEQPPNAHRPGFSAQEQLAFEQRKYEQQAQRGTPRPNNGATPAGPAGGTGSPASWDGMYEGAPQPGMGPSGGRGKGGPYRQQQNTPQPTPSQAPANAPTGPKNPNNRPGGNFRGGRGQRGFHPYARH